MTETQPKPESNGRDARGRFLPGNQVGRRGGRPPREMERQYLEAFQAGCSPERLAKIVAAVAAKAEAGSLEAAKLILRHAMPAWPLRVELASDAEEYRVAGLTAAEVNQQMLKRLIDKIRERREYEASLRAAGVDLGPNQKGPSD